jgi:DNA-binding CsgD family transcriptional regulator
MAKSALSNAGPDSRPGREKRLDLDAGSPGSLQAAGARHCALNYNEEELLVCLDKGLLYKEIEERLHLSHTALRKRQHRLYMKLAAQNRTEALNHWREIYLRWRMESPPRFSSGAATLASYEGREKQV